MTTSSAAARSAPSAAMTAMLQYLRDVRELQGGTAPAPDGLRCRSCEDFVLMHGQEFTVSNRLPRRVRRGKSRACSENAALAVASRRFTYVEGYALNIIPMLHAWIVDRAGVAYELTWETPGDAYFGVPFRRAYVRERARDRGHYGLLAPMTDVELFHADPSAFLAQSRADS